MRNALLTLVAASLCTVPAVAQTYALGVGASTPNSVELKVNGHNKTFRIDSEGSAQGEEAFLNCLVAGRVIRIDHAGPIAKLSMLDKNDVAALVREFVQSKTAADPCALGKAAYVPVHPALATAAPTATARTEPAPAAPATKALSRKTTAVPAPPNENMRVLGAGYSAPTTTRPSTGGFTGPGRDTSAPYAPSLGAAPVETPQTGPGAVAPAPAPPVQAVQPMPAAPPIPTLTPTTPPTSTATPPPTYRPPV